MTRRERLMCIFRGEPPDRPAVRLWGVAPEQELLHPAYAPVRDAALQKTDLVLSAGSPFDLRWGSQPPPIRREDRPTGSPEWVDQVTYVETAAGPLRGVYRVSTCKRPGYIMQYMVKEPWELKKLLSVPYVPHPFDPTDYWKAEQTVGDTGITIFSLPHAMYGLQDLIGSQNFALWSRDCRGELLEVVAEYARRIQDQVKRALAVGIRSAFGWVGPELCIPPLMSVRDFDDFVFAFDRPVIEAIHEAGGCVWVHCHGRMGPVLERFVEMGVDVLNPVEPPPMGDLTLQEAFRRVGGRMGIDGNVETHDLMTMPPDRMRELVYRTLECGRGRRLILCPTSGYMEDPQPSERFIQNLLVFVNDGVRYAQQMAGQRAVS